MRTLSGEVLEYAKPSSFIKLPFQAGLDPKSLIRRRV
jgi:hypothetical protein